MILPDPPPAPMPERLYLSPPHIGPEEQAFVAEAFETNWVAPVGPHVDAFEREFAEHVGAPHAVAVSSGTAALHLALRLVGVGRGDKVAVSDLTFCASVNPILYQGGVPVFVDSERASWNLDPNLVEDLFRRWAAAGRQVKALADTLFVAERIGRAVEALGLTSQARGRTGTRTTSTGSTRSLATAGRTFGLSTTGRA